MKVTKNDKVRVIAGNDKGKEGLIQQVDKKKNKVLVEGVKIVKRHVKPNQMNQQGGIVEKEAWIDSSNVMFVCESCKKPVRLGKRKSENGASLRYCKTCNKTV